MRLLKNRKKLAEICLNFLNYLFKKQLKINNNDVERQTESLKQLFGTTELLKRCKHLKKLKTARKSVQHSKMVKNSSKLNLKHHFLIHTAKKDLKRTVTSLGTRYKHL